MFETCPVCGIKVVPTGDGSCPSCREHVFSADRSPEGTGLETPRLQRAESIDRRGQDDLLGQLMWSVAGRMRVLGVVVLIVAPFAALVAACFSPWASLALLIIAVGGLLLIQTAHAFRECAEGSRKEDWRVAIQSLDRLIAYQYVMIIAAMVPLIHLFWMAYRLASSHRN